MKHKGTMNFESNRNPEETTLMGRVKYLATSRTGRINRRTYFLSYLVLSFCLLASVLTAGSESGLRTIGFGLVIIVLDIPAIFLGIKRCHDLDMSGYWMWLIFIPFLGPLFSIYLFVSGGTPGPNRYGEQPGGKQDDQDDPPLCVQFEQLEALWDQAQPEKALALLGPGTPAPDMLIKAINDGDKALVCFLAKHLPTGHLNHETIAHEYLKGEELVWEQNRIERGKDQLALNPLGLAVTRGLLEISQLLVEQGADLHHALFLSEPAFCRAVFRNDAQMLSFLLQSGADPNQKNIFGIAAVEIAVQWGAVEALALLLGHNVTLGTGFDNPLFTALDVSQLICAKKLWEAGADLGEPGDLWAENCLTEAQSTGVIPFQFLCCLGPKEGFKEKGLFPSFKNFGEQKERSAMISLLLSMGVDPNAGFFPYESSICNLTRKPSPHELVALLEWSRTHHPRELAQELDKAGIREFALFPRQWDLLAAYAFQSEEERTSPPEIAVPWVKINQERAKLTGPWVDHPLFQALWLGDFDQLKQLAAQGEELLVRDVSGHSLLHHGVYSRNSDCLSWLLDQGLEVDAFNLDGVTPLYLALSLGKEDFAVLLLNGGADPNHQTYFNEVGMDFIDGEASLEALLNQFGGKFPTSKQPHTQESSGYLQDFVLAQDLFRIIQHTTHESPLAVLKKNVLDSLSGDFGRLFCDLVGSLDESFTPKDLGHFLDNSTNPLFIPPSSGPFYRQLALGLFTEESLEAYQDELLNQLDDGEANKLLSIFIPTAKWDQESLLSYFNRRFPTHEWPKGWILDLIEKWEGDFEGLLKLVEGFSTSEIQGILSSFVEKTNAESAVDSESMEQLRQTISIADSLANKGVELDIKPWIEGLYAQLTRRGMLAELKQLFLADWTGSYKPKANQIAAAFRFQGADNLEHLWYFLEEESSLVWGDYEFQVLAGGLSAIKERTQLERLFKNNKGFSWGAIQNVQGFFDEAVGEYTPETLHWLHSLGGVDFKGISLLRLETHDPERCEALIHSFAAEGQASLKNTMDAARPEWEALCSGAPAVGLFDWDKALLPGRLAG